MKFLKIFKRNTISIQKQMENTNLSIEDIKFMVVLTDSWFREFKKNLERINSGQFMSPLPLLNPLQVKQIQEEVLKNYTERFEKDALQARGISKKLKLFLDSIL